MKKSTLILSALALFVFVFLRGQFQSEQVITSVLGDPAQTSQSDSPVNKYPLGIGAIPVQDTPDGEQASIFSFSVDPDSEVKGILRLQNQNSDEDLIADVYALGSDPNTAPPSPLSRKKPGPESAWISFSQEKVPVVKGGVQDVPFALHVPGNATPGDHALFLMVETIRPEEAATQQSKQQLGKAGAKIKISSAVAVRIALKVSGKEVMSAKIKELKMTGENPYIFNIAVENTGNVSVKPRITTTIDSVFGTVPSDQLPLAATYEILPGGITTMLVQWNYQKMGIYNLHFKVAYGDKVEVRDAKVVIYPTLPQIAVAILIFLILIAVIAYYIHRRRSALILSAPSVQNLPLQPLQPQQPSIPVSPSSSMSPLPPQDASSQNTIPPAP